MKHATRIAIALLAGAIVWACWERNRADKAEVAGVIYKQHSERVEDSLRQEANRAWGVSGAYKEAYLAKMAEVDSLRKSRPDLPQREADALRELAGDDGRDMRTVLMRRPD